MTISIPDGIRLLIEPAQLAKLLGVTPARVAQLQAFGRIPKPTKRNGPRRAYSLEAALAIAQDRGVGGRANVKVVKEA